MTAPARFCPACGAARNPNAKFCGRCGTSFGRSADTAAPGAPAPIRESGWQVAIGGALPPIEPPALKKKKKKKTAPPVLAVPPPKARSVWGSTLFMAITQGADLMTRAMEGGAETDQTLPLRLGLAAAVAVFGVTLGSTPLLRTVLVRLGTAGIALLQGASLWSQLQGIATDPQLLQAALPNLGAQGASLIAVYRLFRQVGKH